MKHVAVNGILYVTPKDAAHAIGVSIGTLRNQTCLPNGFIKPAINLGRQSLYNLADVERVAAERNAKRAGK